VVARLLFTPTTFALHLFACFSFGLIAILCGDGMALNASIAQAHAEFARSIVLRRWVERDYREQPAALIKYRP